MEKAGFDAASWSHWLLIICFLGLSVWGLALSWQWGEKARTRRKWKKRIHSERKQAERSHRLAALEPSFAKRSSVTYVTYQKSLVRRSVRARSE